MYFRKNGKKLKQILLLSPPHETVDVIKNGASHGDPSAQFSNADYPKRGQRRSGCMEKKKKKEDKKDPPRRGGG